MDPRIEAILAKYDNEVEESQLAVEKSSEPPKTLEEWIQSRPEGLKDWPDPLDRGVGELNISVDSVGLGHMEDIVEDLSTHASLDIGLIDEVSKEILVLEANLSTYSRELLSEEGRPTDSRQHALVDEPVLSPSSLKALSVEHPAEVINKKKRTNQKFGLGDEQANRMKSVQYTSYPGFFPTEVTPLPGQLEAPQLLNKVTKAQNFPQPFRKIWKKLFLSEGSLTVLQDTFWWFFLENFQTGMKSAQDGLFNRIADSFVALFFGVDQEYKDRFFQYYADCLCQAVYAAYCEVFPRSYALFDDRFKAHLLNTVSEWVTGTRPPPRSWERWNLKLLEPRNIRQLQDDRTQSLKANMTFDLDNALDDFTLTKERTGTQLGSISRLGVASGQAQQSHEIGPGPEYERVHFNLLGRSPLVSHFLKMKDLISHDQDQAKRVRRTQVAKLQPDAPTYKQVIKECKKTSRTLNAHYQRVLDSCAQDNLKIQRQKRVALAKLQKLKDDLVMKNQDIKITSERLLDLMAQPGSGTSALPSSALEENSHNDT